MRSPRGGRSSVAVRPGGDRLDGPSPRADQNSRYDAWRTILTAGGAGGFVVGVFTLGSVVDLRVPQRRCTHAGGCHASPSNCTKCSL